MMRNFIIALVATATRAVKLDPGPTHGCCRRPLRVGRFSGSAPPWIYEGDSLESASGFLPEVAYMIFNEMKVDETFVDLGLESGTFSNNKRVYEALDDGTIDVMFEVPLSFPDARLKYTLPFFEIQTSVIVRKERKNRGVWGILDPFESFLWFMIVVAIVAGGLVVAALEPASKFSRSEPLSGRAELLVRAQYDALVLILAGDERDWATWSQRFFRVGLLVLSVVVLSTYTARRRARASPLIVR